MPEQLIMFKCSPFHSHGRVELFSFSADGFRLMEGGRRLYISNANAADSPRRAMLLWFGL